MTVCPGCGLELPEHEGPTHPYIGASPACWALYGEVLAREYEDPAYFAVHHLTVDAYAAQHPGKPERRSIGRLTVAAVHAATDPEAHARAVRAWAEDVWSAWAPHHATVRRWIAARISPSSGSST